MMARARTGPIPGVSAPSETPCSLRDRKGRCGPEDPEPYPIIPPASLVSPSPGVESRTSSGDDPLGILEKAARLRGQVGVVFRLCQGNRFIDPLTLFQVVDAGGLDCPSYMNDHGAGSRGSGSRGISVRFGTYRAPNRRRLGRSYSLPPYAWRREENPDTMYMGIQPAVHDGIVSRTTHVAISSIRQTSEERAKSILSLYEGVISTEIPSKELTT